MGLADRGLDTRTAGLDCLEDWLNFFDFGEAALVDGGSVVDASAAWWRWRRMRKDTRQEPSPVPGLSGLIPGTNCPLVDIEICAWGIRPDRGR